MTIKGGAGGAPGNPFDSTDEGVFISKVGLSTIFKPGFYTCVSRSRNGARCLTMYGHQ